MRSLARGSTLVLAIAVSASCHSAPPPPPAPPPVLSDSATAALRWVEAHAATLSPNDSVPNAAARSAVFALAGDARIIGLSELTEGTHQFPNVVRQMLFALADSGVRGLAIQGPMAEALEVDRYVRSGVGDPRRLLRIVGRDRWDTREMLGLVEAMRDWNRAHPDRQLGFYGFEIPSAAHAVQVVTSLPDSIVGATLHAWLRSTYGCVAENESAHWGLEGRTVDSAFWNRCGPATTAALDSVIALRQRTAAGGRSATLDFAVEMARLIQHHVRVGLEHTTRHGGNAEHVMFIANQLGANAKLLLWGGDVEMGRLTLERTTVQTGVPLGEQLHERYRAIAFAVGDGVIRARRPATGRGGDPGGYSDIPLRRPTPNTYEDVLWRAPGEGMIVDARTLPIDNAGAWLRGPRSVRLISEFYAPEAPDAFLTPIALPVNYDAIVFVKHVTAARE